MYMGWGSLSEMDTPYDAAFLAFRSDPLAAEDMSGKEENCIDI